MNLNVFFLEDAFGIGRRRAKTWVLIGLGVTTVASGLARSRARASPTVVGRKPVIYASAALGAVGMPPGRAGAASRRSPSPGSPSSGSASGAFLSVDWALMTDIIPKASAGRYMGLSNIVEATERPRRPRRSAASRCTASGCWSGRRWAPGSACSSASSRSGSARCSCGPSSSRVASRGGGTTAGAGRGGGPAGVGRGPPSGPAREPSRAIGRRSISRRSGRRRGPPRRRGGRPGGCRSRRPRSRRRA